MSQLVDHSPHKENRLDGVDLLRALAILFVLMNHVNIRLLLAGVPYTKNLPNQLVHSLVWNGQLGVQIFFAVSGFLITSTTLRRWGALANVRAKDFYRLRFARIAPLLFALLAVLSILHFTRLEDFVVTQKTGGLGAALLAALTFHINVLEAHRGYLPGNWDILWSLSVEEMFYLFFPVVCLLLGRSKVLIAFLLTLVALGPVARTHGSDLWQEYSYLGGMDAIALGCLTAIGLHGRRLSRALLATSAILGGALMMIILGFSVRVYHWGLGRIGVVESILAVGTCLVIAAAAQSHWRSPRIFAPLLVLGRRSYEIYLTHMFVVFALFHLYLRAGKRLAVVPILFLGVIFLAAVLGELLARFYSEPINHRLRKRWGTPSHLLGASPRESQNLSR